MANEPKMHLRAVAPGFHCIARRAEMTSGSVFRSPAACLHRAIHSTMLPPRGSINIEKT